MAEKYWQVVDTADIKKGVEGKCRCYYSSFSNIYVCPESL